MSFVFGNGVIRKTAPPTRTSASGPRVALALLVLSTTGSAAESEWVLISKSAERQAYVNVARTRSEGDRLLYWSMESFGQPTTLGPSPPHISRKTLTSIDCARETAATLSVVGYSGPDGTGDVTFTFDFSKTERRDSAVVPNTFGDTEMQLVCKTSRKR